MAKIRKNNALAAIISVAIIVLLVIAGPAQGFTLALGLDNNNPEKGQKISFTVDLDIEAGEHLPVELITLTMNGPENLACQFDAQGNPIIG
ncbi:MAG: hypothetical protein KC506_03355, partial [Nanoarchaeota archaeon]|nr:hypothetical protein [Nanoarchaeota archaeon]